MKSRRRNVSEDGLTISQLNSQSTTSMNGRENSLPIPIDLEIEIFSRLPAKSIARCRCVSKLWASILRLPDFTETYLTKSSDRPQILFACKKRSELSIFSTPQPQNADESSSPLTASYHMNIPFNSSFEIFSPIDGLLCLSEQRILEGRKNPVWVSVISNPSTGQSLVLPKMNTRRNFEVMSYLGFDPIGKHYKVLSMTFSYGFSNGNCEEYQVLTLGAGNLSWRLIECCMPHCPPYHQISINGVLYYLASCVDGSSMAIMLVCFDFRSEEFRFVNFVDIFTCVARSSRSSISSAATLVNYNGKLGTLTSGGYGNVGRANTMFELWVLEDIEKQEWSKHVYVLPPLWRKVIGMAKLIFVGMIGTNEIVLSPLYLYAHSYVFCYNIERNTVVRVKIQGMELFEGSRVHTFLNHVENVKLMQLF